MFRKETTVTNPTGLHARPASDFVKLAKEYPCEVTLCKSGGEAINAKSIVQLLVEGIHAGTVVEIAADGAQEQQAVEALVALIESGFGE